MPEDSQSMPENRPLGFTRLPAPTAREIEDQTASYVEETLQLYDGRLLGRRTRKDGHDGLRVDFTFDSTDPAVAMEVTALTSPDIAALNAELLKLETQLDDLAKGESLGGWVLGIRVGTDLRRLRPVLMEFLRSQRDRSGVCIFSAEQAPDDLDSASLSLLARVLDLGLESALRNDDAGVVTFPPVAAPDSLDRGFATLLRAAVADNAAKLDEARPRETHLAVYADRSVSADPAHTTPPPLPGAIDELWVLLGYYNAKWTYRLWRTTRRDSRWQLLRHPLGEPPRLHSA